jgi:DNA-binding beta-propeller fold protein YncE
MTVFARVCAILLTAGAAFAAVAGPSCAQTGAGAGDAGEGPVLEAVRPLVAYGEMGGIVLGEPLAVAVDFDGNAIVGDGSPGRLVMYDREGARAMEYDQPHGYPGFFPTDIALYGFFAYAIDERSRLLVRFDKDGTYLDVLLNFEQFTGTRRVSPYGMGVDAQGRIAITDIENHQVLLIDSFLRLDILFGNYGSYPGQLDTPLGVSFTATGEVVVADTGNRRVQFFSDAGEPLRVVPADGEPNPLRMPRRAVVDRDGVVYVADPESGAVFIFDGQGRLSRGIAPEGVDGFQPTDLEIHRDGKLFVTDAMSRVLYVFKVM